MQRRDTWDSTFARGMKEVREQLGKSQQWLAEQMATVGYDWHQSTVYKAENGSRKVSIGEAAALADIMNVDLDHLLAASQNEQEQLDRMVWNAADNFLGTLLKLEVLAREAFREQQLLTAAIERFDSKGYMTRLRGATDQLATAREVYAALTTFDGHIEFWKSLAGAYERHDFEEVSSATQGVVGLGPAPWEGEKDRG